MLSSAAVARVQFRQCARRLHVGCYQSDWMIGQCVANDHGIEIASDLSCGLCRIFCHAQIRQKYEAVLRRLQRGTCAFAQHEAKIRNECPYGARALVVAESLCNQAPNLAAISHGFRRDCSAGVQLRPETVSLGARAFWRADAVQERRRLLQEAIRDNSSSTRIAELLSIAQDGYQDQDHGGTQGGARQGLQGSQPTQQHQQGAAPLSALLSVSRDAFPLPALPLPATLATSQAAQRLRSQAFRSLSSSRPTMGSASANASTYRYGSESRGPRGIGSQPEMDPNPADLEGSDPIPEDPPPPRVASPR